MPTASERAVLEQLAEAPASYMAIERFIFGSDRVEALAVMLRLAEDGHVSVMRGGAPVAMSNVERWAAAPLDPAIERELGAVEVDITEAGLGECVD